MQLGFGLGLTNVLPFGTVALDPDAAIAALFESGEEGAWYDPSDSTTVFQDAAGTTPAGVGDPVGLILDKSKGATPGPELLTNGDMSSSTGWVLSSGISISSGQMLFSSAGFNAEARQPVVSSGKWYYYEVNVASITSGVLSLVIGNLTAKSSLSAGINSGYYFLQTAQDADAGIVAKDPGGPTTAAVDYFVLKELPGNHATQTTSAARPILQQSGATAVLSGTELVTNGTFDTDTTGWSANRGASTLSVVSQKLRNTATGSTTGDATQTLTGLTIGKTYKVTANAFIGTVGQGYFRVSTSNTLLAGAPVSIPFNTDTLIDTTFVANASTLYVGVLGVFTAAGQYCEIDNISVQEVTSWSGGLRYLDFDGVDDSMAAAFAAQQAQPNTIAIAAAQTSTVGVNYLYDSTDINARHTVLARSTANSYEAYAGVSVFYSSLDTAAKIHNVLFNGASSNIRVNGSVLSTANLGSHNWSGIKLASRQNDTDRGDIKFYGFVGVNRTLTAGEISDLESYLATKSGVTLSAGDGGGDGDVPLDGGK